MSINYLQLGESLDFVLATISSVIGGDFVVLQSCCPALGVGMEK